MIWLRRLIIAFPLVLLGFFGIAFFSVRVTPPKKLNQLTIGSIGEAKILNPILYTTGADAEIIELVFRGLVKYDEDLNTVADLAERWTISQNSLLFFATPAQAADALRVIQGNRERWANWNLADAGQDGPRVGLALSKAGTSYQESLLSLIEKQQPLPVSFVRIGIAKNAKIGTNLVTSATFWPVLQAEIGKTPSLAARLHSHFINTSAEFDLVVAGDTTEFVALANRLLKAEAGRESLGQCAVAETFPVLNEPEIVFQLRRGVRWHDGKPFSARDVDFTYRAIMNEAYASPRRADYELVRELQLPDAHTVRVVYRKPYAPCLMSWSMGMLPQHILDGQASQWWAKNFNRSPVGTGPYKFDKWLSNQYVRLRRNDDYWEGKPHIEQVTVRVIPDMVSLRLSFETGEVDYWGVEPHANKKFQDHPRYEVFSRIAPSYSYVGWNLKRPMFQDVKVRRALAHAVNVPQIIEYVLYGQGVQSTGPFPPQMWFANPNVKPIEYDPAKAKALLAEAGWKPGPNGLLQKDGKPFKFTLITNHPNEIRKDIATLVQNDLKKLGIEVDVQIYEWAVFIDTYINKHDFDACVLGWNLGYDYDQYQLWHSSQAQPGMLNHSSYANKEVDRLLELARSEFDEERAKQYCHEIHRIIYEDQPYLFLAVPKATGTIRRGEFRVKRPDGKGDWIEEPVRGTKVGFLVYQDWWYRPQLTP